MENGSGDKTTYAALASAVRDLQTTLYGDPLRRIVGIAEKIDFLIEAEKARVIKDAKRDAEHRGIMYGLSFTGLASGGTLLTVLVKFFMGVP